MASSKNILGFRESGSKKTSVVGTTARAHNTEPVDLAEYAARHQRRKPKHLIGLLFAHGSRAKRSSLPRTDIQMSVFTPCGKTAVRLRV